MRIKDLKDRLKSFDNDTEVIFYSLKNHELTERHIETILDAGIVENCDGNAVGRCEITISLEEEMEI